MALFSAGRRTSAPRLFYRSAKTWPRADAAQRTANAAAVLAYRSELAIFGDSHRPASADRALSPTAASRPRMYVHTSVDGSPRRVVRIVPTRTAITPPLSEVAGRGGGGTGFCGRGLIYRGGNTLSLRSRVDPEVTRARESTPPRARLYRFLIISPSVRRRNDVRSRRSRR